MTEHKDRPSTSASQLNLVNSRRLQALRKQVSGSAAPQAAESAAPTQPQESAKDSQLRRLAEQRLADILAQLPAGKQQQLFKIRFGITPDELQALPAKQFAEKLKIMPGKH